MAAEFDTCSGAPNPSPCWTEAKIAELARGRIQIQVASGQVNLTVFKGSEANVEIDTPNLAVHPVREF